MKNILILWFLCVVCSAAAQYPQDSLRDNVWVLGAFAAEPPYTRGLKMDFTNGEPAFSLYNRNYIFEVTNGNICNQAGQHLLSTNGFVVYNALHDTLPNGVGLNPSTNNCLDPWCGQRIPQGALILPFPNHDSLYYIIHSVAMEYFIDTVYTCDTLYSTLVNTKANNGQGLVIEKNKKILNKFLDAGKITATRHANGRDWWIMVSDYVANNLEILILDPSGIRLHHTQHFVENLAVRGLGGACFSPDGTKYINLNSVKTYLPQYLNIYDFDRCTGLFSNYREIIVHPTGGLGGGVAISPNSKYAYIATQNDFIYQYDLQASDIAASRITVAVYDGFNDIFPPNDTTPTHFGIPQLAPNNKIYISTLANTRYMHIIHQPNEHGIACGIQQHFMLPNVFNGISIPNFPYFRLGPVDGSVCDSLGIDNIIVSTETALPEKEPTNIKIYPNPSTGLVNITLNIIENGSITVVDMLGRSVYQQNLIDVKNNIKLDLSTLEAGVYFIKIQNSERELSTHKITIIK